MAKIGTLKLGVDTLDDGSGYQAVAAEFDLEGKMLWEARCPEVRATWDEATADMTLMAQSLADECGLFPNAKGES